MLQITAAIAEIRVRFITKGVPRLKQNGVAAEAAAFHCSQSDSSQPTKATRYNSRSFRIIAPEKP
ncbi:MAG: hypothetical protein KDA89_08650 [Planctomycetaceae bacterium]|nr:hypothetical protein [Planctomycetaceae bacterium]